MVEALLALLLAAASACAAIFWRKSSEARERATEEVNRLREQARRKQAERSAQAKLAYAKSKQATDHLTDSQSDRQKLADMLNGE